MQAVYLWRVKCLLCFDGPAQAEKYQTNEARACTRMKELAEVERLQGLSEPDVFIDDGLLRGAVAINEVLVFHVIDDCRTRDGTILSSAHTRPTGLVRGYFRLARLITSTHVIRTN